MKNKLTTLSAIVLLISMLLSSCQKEKFTPVNTNEPHDISQDAKSLKQMISRTEIVFAALSGSVSFKNEDASSILNCADVNTDSVSMPRVTVINYGLTGCVGTDGVSRKGKMVITYDGDFHDAGTYVVTTYSNYYEDDNQVTGSTSYHNEGENGNGNLVYTISNDNEIIFANGGGTEKHVLT